MPLLKAQHLFDLCFISDPQVSPSGEQILAVHSTIQQPKDDSKEPDYHSHIHIYQRGTKGSRQFTFSGQRNSQARFSPAGNSISFLRKDVDSPQAQLYLIGLEGGEARCLTSLTSGVSQHCWHPDGQRIVFISRGDWEDTVTKRGQARVIDRKHYKMDGQGFRPSEVPQLYLYDLKTSKTTVLSSLSCTPQAPVFDSSGTYLYFTAAESTPQEDDWLRNIYRLELASGQLETILSEPMMLSSLSLSPFDERLVFIAPQEVSNFASPPGLWLIDSPGSQPRLISEQEVTDGGGISGDCRFGNYGNQATWLDSDTLLVNINTAGRAHLHHLSLSSRQATAQHQGDSVVTAFHHSGGTTAFLLEHSNTPGELFELNSKSLQLSQANRHLKRFGLAASVAKEVSADDNVRLEYWQLSAPKPRADKALVLQIHGGPHSNYGYGFNFEFQLLAAAGYSVIFGNPRGSTSYGLDFATACLGDYGGRDAADVLTIARDARKQFPAAPMHITGGSYGGFMTNWLIAHTTEFRSAVTLRSICNWLSFYGSSDIGYRFTEREQGGNPWDDTEKLWQQSPIRYVKAIETPLLIIHSEQDHRCPIEQAEQLFIALKQLGKETRFIRFPDEGHELSRSGRPDRRLERLEAILEWFESHP